MSCEHCIIKTFIISLWQNVFTAFGRTTHTDPKDMRARQQSRQKTYDQIPSSHSSAAVSPLKTVPDKS